MRGIVFSCRLLLVLELAAAAGCGREYSPAEGTITLDGTPLSGATVIFQSPDLPLATARTNKTGHYQVETGGAQGVMPGEYVVTIAAYQKSKAGMDDTAPNLAIPKKYLQPQSSGLKAVIVDGANRNVDFDLKTR